MLSSKIHLILFLKIKVNANYALFSFFQEIIYHILPRNQYPSKGDLCDFTSKSRHYYGSFFPKTLAFYGTRLYCHCADSFKVRLVRCYSRSVFCKDSLRVLFPQFVLSVEKSIDQCYRNSMRWRNCE